MKLKTRLSSVSHALIRSLRATSGRSLRPLVWSLVLSSAATGVAFLSNFALARLLGRPSFGEWAAIQSTLTMVSGIAQLSMAVTATRYVAQYRASRPDRVGAILGLCSLTTSATGILAAGALLFGAPLVARVALGAPELTLPVRISALSVLLSTMSGYQLGALAGLERFRLMALLSLGNGVAGLALTLALGIPYGVPGALAGQAVGQILNWASHRLALNQELRHAGIRASWRSAASEAGVLVSFTVPATLCGIAGMLGLWGGTVALVRAPGGFSEMALFAAASVLRGVVLFAPQVLYRVSSPVLTRMCGTGEYARYRSALLDSVLLAFASSGVTALGISLFSPRLVTLFGPAFRGGSLVVIVLALAGVFESMATACGQEFVTTDRMWTNMRVFASRAVMIVGGTLLLAPGYGALGAATAHAAAHLVALLVSAYHIRFQAQSVAASLPPADLR